MTGNGRSRLFRFAVVAAALVAGACGSTPKKPPEALIELPEGAAVRAELSASEAVDGSVLLVLLRVPPGAKMAPVAVNFDEKKLPVFAAPALGDGAYMSVLGIPYGYKPGPAAVQVEFGKGEEKETVQLSFVVRDGEYPSEVLKVAPKHVDPPKKALRRIKKEVAEISRVYKRLTPEKHWQGPFLLPIESIVTSPYGSKRVFNGQIERSHLGTDLRAPVGTPIRSPAAGVVVLAKDLYFTGNTVFLDHGYGVITFYAHMSRLEVKSGQKVRAGQQLGLSGMTGRASGPHLHWGAVIHKEKVNPLDLTRVMK